MTQEILKLIEACQWDTVTYLFVSKNVFDPLIYYSHLFPLVMSLVIGVFIFFKSWKQLNAKILFLVILSTSCWIFSDLIVWATNKPHLTMFFWSLVNMVEPIIYAGMLYFLYVFIDGRDISFKKKLIIVGLLLPTLLLTPTKFAILGYDISNCDRDVIEGPLAYYGYIIEVIYIVWILCLSISRFIRNKNLIEKRKIALVSIGSVGFLTAFAFGNIIGSLFDTYSIGGEYSWTVGQYGIFGIPVFIVFLTYLIVKFHSFNLKVFSTQALVVGLNILIGSEFFFVKTLSNQILVGVTFIFSIVLGYFLIKSVGREIEQREDIQKLAGQLQSVNTGLSEANSKLRLLDTQKSEFVSFASHQLRSPLTAIKGYASLILEGDYGVINEKAKEAVKIMFDSTNTLVHVVEDYLNISRIELGTMKYNFTSIDWKDLSHTVIEELRPNVEKAGLKISFECDMSKTYMISADLDKFKQTIVNIIDNSVKYTPKGEIKVSLTKNETKKTILFAVKDTGVGINALTIPKLFSKFVRDTHASETNIHGTGLGLYVAKQMVLAHKGDVWAESEGEGKGAQFYVEMPEER